MYLSNLESIGQQNPPGRINQLAYVRLTLSPNIEQEGQPPEDHKI